MELLHPDRELRNVKTFLLSTEVSEVDNFYTNSK